LSLLSPAGCFPVISFDREHAQGDAIINGSTVAPSATTVRLTLVPSAPNPAR
jgi:hypothetical protein